MEENKNIKKFNAQKEIASLKSFNKLNYDNIEEEYLTILKYVNEHFVLSEFETEMKLTDLSYFMEKAENILNLVEDECTRIKKYKTEVKSDNSLSECDKNKVLDYLKEHLYVHKNFLLELGDLYNVMDNSYKFFKIYLVPDMLKIYLCRDFNCHATYALPVFILKKKLKENKIKVPYELNHVFKRAKKLVPNEKTFIIISPKELEILKMYNNKINNPVNFPVWNPNTFTHVKFENGKGTQIFDEYADYL